MAISRVLVVGGGIAGLSLGAAAAQHGIEVDVVERLHQAVEGAAGIGLHPPAQRMFDRLGLLDQIRAVAFDLDGYHFVDANGHALGMQPYAAVWGSPTWSVHRADLHAALRSTVPSNTVRVGIGFETASESEGEVIARFSDGSEAPYDLIVGADGVHSKVRAAVLGEQSTRYGGACFWRTTLPRRIVDGALGHVMAGGSLGLIPLVGDRTHAFFQVRSDEPFVDPVAGRCARLRDRFPDAPAKVVEAFGLLGSDDSVHFGQLEWIEPPAWGEGRIVLIGDAAHAMAPPLALGGCMALEDGIVLADELAANADLAGAIATFKTRRGPRVEFVQERTRIAWDRNRGVKFPDEPIDPVEFGRRNFLPLLDAP